MDRNELQQRTKQFHVNVIILCEKLPKGLANYEISRQLIRSAGSVGANYRATKRAKSTNDFINKVKIVIEEADESLYWLEVLKEINKTFEKEILTLIKEADELTSIFVAAHKTLIKNKQD